MPHIVIDGKRIETSNGKTVIEAAYENGIEIAHFCWHPELSVSGNCRMCLVEIGLPKRLADGSTEIDGDGNPVISYFPKLQIACATVVSDGMHIKTASPKVLQAREAVMEFLLINHPLDCPICDEAGECKLQEYAYRHSRGYSRFIDEKNAGLKRQEWGDNVMYDAERCIKCSRCIRYAQEVAHQDVLTFVQRGDHVTIEVAKGERFNNPYSMNVIEICPVGALTSRDFRFKSRVWDMSFNDSICPGCARGCNMKIGVRNNEILRLEPRSNPYVNKYWLCDYGRLTQYKNVNLNRITEPEIKVNNGEKEKISWDEAVQKVADILKTFKPNEIMFLGSAFATNEDNYLLQKFAKSLVGTSNIDFLRHEDSNFGDDFLKQNDKTPNSKGALEVGVQPAMKGIGKEQLIEKIKFGNIKLLYIMDDDLEDYPELIDEMDNLNVLIVHGKNNNKLTAKADIVLPCSTFAEVEGTFVNFAGRVQHFQQALVTAENLRYMGMKMSRLDKFGAPNDRWTQHELRNCKPNWMILVRIANKLGGNWRYSVAEDVFNEIATQVGAFKGMSYELLDEYQGLVLNRAERPDTKIINYDSHTMKPF
ncbi:NADH-quinone oxidoreductase subunit G [Bacteroidetes/Chlorobi group bacterium ChocPot_Mid]|nr:MAG: NADH-quinone oxidoreductase subunit G [Bacteroidetes/Chlorobi group bacterium ChocPot_Mid]